MIKRWLWRKLRWMPLVAAAGAVAPVVVTAPPKPEVDAPESVAELVAGCRATGAEGRELVDEAVRAVARAYPYDSFWHLWESPERSLRMHRGWSHQYNTVLLFVLRELGFTARVVHAARVRGFNLPWFLQGHSWVKVEVEGHELDACAASEDNRVGAVSFIPLTSELPMRSITRWAVGMGLVPFVVGEIWAAWLGGRDVAGWLYGRRQDREVEPSS